MQPDDDLKWIIARELPHLRRFARSLLRDPEEADDLVQDSLERGLRKRHLWRRRGSMRSWLFSVLYSQYRERQRRQGRQAARRASVRPDTAVVAGPGQEARVECLDVLTALDHLPEAQRSAIVLAALEDMPYDEIATTLGISTGALRARLFRGREALRATLQRAPRPAALRRVK